MPDEPKIPPQPSESGETRAKQPAPERGGTPAPSAAPGKPEGTAATDRPSVEVKPPETPKPAVPAKPAAVAAEGAGVPAKPAASAKPAAAAPKAPPKPPVKPEPWASPLLDALRQKFPGAISDATIFRNQPCVIVAKESLVQICGFLKSEEGGAYTLLTDQTAVDYPKREKRFDIIYQLYSFKGNDRLRLKVFAGEGEKVPSVADVWPTANWLEREVFDMFGVLYEGHPDLKRILLPDGWTGYPLRKDYDILQQDDAWVKENLHIESGQ